MFTNEGTCHVELIYKQAKYRSSEQPSEIMNCFRWVSIRSTTRKLVGSLITINQAKGLETIQEAP